MSCVSYILLRSRVSQVIVHTGLPNDQAVATGIVSRIKERFGGLVNVSALSRLWSKPDGKSATVFDTRYQVPVPCRVLNYDMICHRC